MSTPGRRPVYLRFTPEEYQALLQASRSLDLRGAPAAFRAALAAGLQPGHPALAGRVAGLSEAQTVLLRSHLRGEGDQASAASDPQPAEEAVGLTVREWQVVARATELVRLLGECPEAFPRRLLREVAEADPALAAKLARLNAAQFAALARRARSGRRSSA